MDFHDPTILNPVIANTGIQNWLGLPGALLGGSLLEILGPSALLLAWFLIPLSYPSGHSFSLLSGWYHSFLLVWMISILHALVETQWTQSLLFHGLWGYGYLGTLGARWILNYIEPVYAIAVIAFVGLYSSLKILSALPFMTLAKFCFAFLAGFILIIQKIPWYLIPAGIQASVYTIIHFVVGLVHSAEILPMSSKKQATKKSKKQILPTTKVEPTSTHYEGAMASIHSPEPQDTDMKGEHGWNDLETTIELAESGHACLLNNTVDSLQRENKIQEPAESFPNLEKNDLEEHFLTGSRQEPVERFLNLEKNDLEEHFLTLEEIIARSKQTSETYKKPAKMDCTEEEKIPTNSESLNNQKTNPINSMQALNDENKSIPIPDGLSTYQKQNAHLSSTIIMNDEEASSLHQTFTLPTKPTQNQQETIQETGIVSNLTPLQSDQKE